MNEQKLVKLLSDKGWHICCAESCTGGMLSSAIVNVDGASSVIDMGFVTYANEAKVMLIGVDPDTIAQYGVVSEAVAGQMAKGAAAKAKAEVGVGISGIAGPGGGTPTKPVGTVCFGFYIDGKVYTETMHFGDIGRLEVRKSSCKHAINTLIEKVSSV